MASHTLPFQKTRAINRARIVMFVAAASSLGVVGPTTAQSQNNAVVETVQRFFDAMAEGDTAASKAVMFMDGQYYAVQESDSLRIARTTHRDYLRRLATGSEKLLERMWNPTVLVHGRIAVVWVAYDFYRDTAFSHCGVDAFNLIQTADGWKISGVIFTRETQDCPPSPLGPPTDLRGATQTRPARAR